YNPATPYHLKHEPGSHHMVTVSRTIRPAQQRTRLPRQPTRAGCIKGSQVPPTGGGVHAPSTPAANPGGQEQPLSLGVLREARLGGRQEDDTQQQHVAVRGVVKRTRSWGRRRGRRRRRSAAGSGPSGASPTSRAMTRKRGCTVTLAMGTMSTKLARAIQPA